MMTPVRIRRAVIAGSVLRRRRQTVCSRPGARAPMEIVGACIAMQVVVTFAAVDRVAAAEAEDDVVARAAIHGVMPGSGVDSQ